MSYILSSGQPGSVDTDITFNNPIVMKIPTDFQTPIPSGHVTALIGQVPITAVSGLQTEWIEIKMNGETRYIAVWG